MLLLIYELIKSYHRRFQTTSAPSGADASVASVSQPAIDDETRFCLWETNRKWGLKNAHFLTETQHRQPLICVTFLLLLFIRFLLLLPTRGELRQCFIEPYGTFARASPTRNQQIWCQDMKKETGYAIEDMSQILLLDLIRIHHLPILWCLLYTCYILQAHALYCTYLLMLHMP